MGTSSVLLVGGGGHAKVVLESLFSAGRTVSGIFDNQKAGSVFDIPFLGDYSPNIFPDAELIIAIGDNAVRKQLSSKLYHTFTTTVHQTVIVSDRAAYGLGCMLLHGVIIQAEAALGNHVIVNTGAQIDHDCKIEDFAHIGPGSVLCGNVSIGEGTLIGAGSTVAPNIKIGRWAVIGAGSVVVNDLPDYCVAFGNPARVRKQRQQ